MLVAEGIALKKQTSKELQIVRQRKTKDARKKKVKARDIRLAKDWNEYEEIPGVVIEFPDTKEISRFNVKLTPGGGFYKGASFEFAVEVSEQYPIEAPKVWLLGLSWGAFFHGRHRSSAPPRPFITRTSTLRAEFA